MKTVKNLFFYAALFTVAACSKESPEPTGNQAGATELSTLSIASSFNWSSSLKGELKLTVKEPQFLSVENQWLELRDAEGKIVGRDRIENGLTHFYISLPAFDEKLYAYYPNTEESFEINAAGNQVIQLAELDLESFDNASKKSVTAVAKATGSNSVINGDFETTITGVDNRDALELRPQGQWYIKGNLGLQTQVNGSTVFTNPDKGDNAYILQSIVHTGNKFYDFSFDYSGYAKLRIITYDKNMNRVGYINTSGNGSTGGLENLFVSNEIGYIQLYMYVRDGGWIDNVTVTRVTEIDTDNDGVIDAKDDYPNNASKSHASYFPLIGRQTVAFEDLWPNMGDFDFNDMVVSNLVEYGHDAQGNLVDATFKVRVDAFGGGFSSGVAVVLLQPNKQPLQGNIIASVTGDATIDPQVTNGLVVFDNVRTALDQPYQNNGEGPDGEPQEFVFTVTFSGNINEKLVIPDFYIFRSTDRGHEIHLDGFGPTAAANPALFNTGDDFNGTYNTKKGLPWAVELIYPGTIFFKHPLEKVDILVAYPNFQQWAESKGAKQVGWMVHPNNGKVYVK